MRKSGVFIYLGLFLILCVSEVVQVFAEDPVQFYIPAIFYKFLVNEIDLPDGFVVIDEGAYQADLWVVMDEVVDDEAVGEIVFALVTPYNNADEMVLTQRISEDDLMNAWHGDQEGVIPLPVWMDQAILDVLQLYFGEPAKGAVSVVMTDELLDILYPDNPQAFAIVAFQDLEPRWHVLQIDGISPLTNDFDGLTSDYPLAFHFAIHGQEEVLVDYLMMNEWTSNRHVDELTTVAMTGVTALVRGTAFLMEEKSVLYPAEEIGDFLSAQDITHINNEVPFMVGCKFPDPEQIGVLFCSDPRYYDLLEFVGIDVVELAGDHFRDQGDAVTLFTLGLYEAHDIPYYGGGMNIEDGRGAAILEHHGNRFAFLGCNAKQEEFSDVHATVDEPGAVPCDFDYLSEEIPRLVGMGYQVIFTFQDYEYYIFPPNSGQRMNGQFVADAGATIVSGSQAHHPKAVEFREDTFINYGLGNLFFDQLGAYEFSGTAMIAVHSFYQNRHIGSEFVPIVFVDDAKPRFATDEEAQELFEFVFAASFWE